MDQKYVINYLANLLRIPTRIYTKGKKTDEFFFNLLNNDPFQYTAEELLLTEQHIDYVITKFHQLYGIVKNENTSIVLGPAGYYNLDVILMSEYAFLLGITDKECLNIHVGALKTITPLSLEFFVNILCLINYFINKEKLTPVDIIVKATDQNVLTSNFADDAQTINNQQQPVIHDTYSFEQKMLSFITAGNVTALQQLFTSSAPIGGILSNNIITQDKYMFISTLALVARAAIKGGIEPPDALQLCDVYSLQCERLYASNSIKNLQYRMIMDFTERVANLKIINNQSLFVTSIANYIQKNLMSKIEGQDIAKHVHMSRSSMCKKFKKETNKTITEYILEVKIAESKRLLTFTSKTLSEIAIYLGYSSQSHFQNSFRKLVGITPALYRKTMSS